MEARQITLNLVPGGVMPRIHCSQYDKGVPVEVTLYDGDTTYTVPEDATVYVQGAKLDGTLYQYECTASGSVVTFDLTIQMTVIAGENTAELAIYQGDDVVGTCNFIIDVEDSALQDPSQTSYNDIPVIADLPGLVADAQEYAETAQEAAQDALDAVDEIDLDMEEIRSAVTKASTSADLASGFADSAEDWYKYSKSYAVGDEIRAGSTVDNAMFYMNEAKDAAEDTAADVVTVEGLLEDIQAIETRTQGYANTASQAKTSTETIYAQTLVAKTSADNFAKLSESWAHGQTGVRTGEDTDNAMYWANKAQAVAKTTVDSAFSTSSLNPVENRVITNQHVNVNINQQNGVHGLRYYNDVLEYYDTDTNTWVEIETGGGTLIVQPPVAAEQTYTYDGTEQTFAFSSIDTANCNISNNKKTAAGTYEVTVSLKESNYVWADDLTNTDRTFTWTINKATVAIPVAASQTYTYDGTLQTFAFTTTIDTTLINVTGNEQTNAGSYTVSCALVDSNNYEWADNTTAAKTYSWTIAKAASSISVSPASITFDADNLTATLVPTTTGDGAVSYSGYDSSIITIAGNVVTATQATGNTTITATIAETTNYTSASTTVAVTAAFLVPHIFAVHYSENDSNPDSATYPSGYDNEGWTPFAMNLSTGVPNYGSWDPNGANADAVSWLFPKPCMLKYDGTVDYYLDEDDYTKKADGVTASDVADSSYAGNAMMEWEQIFWKIVPDSDGKGFTFVVANAAVDKDGNEDTDMVPWNNYNCQGNLASHFYTPIYIGSSDGTRLRSISGASHAVGNTAQEGVNLAKANNLTSDEIWLTEVYVDRILLQMLYILLSRSTNAQAKFGTGYGSSSHTGPLQPGTMNDKGLFYGLSNGDSGVKAFGMEHPWCNLQRRVQGLINNKGTVKVKLTYGTQDGSQTTGYNMDGTGYLSAGTVTAGINGTYISHMTITEKSIIPSGGNGSNSTYYCDMAQTATDKVCYGIFGGGWADTTSGGPFLFALRDEQSNNWVGFGQSISCKPLT